MATPDQKRKLPSVDRLLGRPEILQLIEQLPRALVVDAVRATIEDARDSLNAGEAVDLSLDRLAKCACEAAERAAAPSLKNAVNATGVILHTGLGRSVLCWDAIEALLDVAREHSTLEIDLETGRRGSRTDHVEGLLCRLTGAEAATVVNNNAAAVLLAINTIADGGEVIISRGQLVEIGGQFRIPDIIARAGGKLVEVGTTNRTRLSDYEAEVFPFISLVLRVHPSNFRVVGFTEETPLDDLAELCHSNGVPLMDDLGSGALIDLSQFCLKDEPLVQESVRAGCDLVTFSGDKLLGGPQAGIIVGRKELVDQCKQNPLARALRVDKLTLAALEATLKLYLDPEKVIVHIPTLRYITRSPEEIAKQARGLATRLRKELGDAYSVQVESVSSQVGGGALPGQDIPSSAVTLTSRRYSAEDLSAWFRKNEVPIFGRIENDKLVFDLRTVEPAETKTIIERARTLAGRE